jgi:MYXO-CTERM domain-containing protein
MTDANVAGYAANAQTSTSAAAKLIARCQETIDQPSFYNERGGADGDNWPGAAMSCAFAYRVTQQAAYLTQALKYWHAALDHDQTIPDNLGCTVANSTFDWRNQWNGDFPPPPVLLTVTHDTGYPMRWYGPYIALVYDWLYGAPGVDDTLRAQTRTCLTAWIDNYTIRGYLRDKPGSNYQAGFVVGKTLAAVSIGNDGGADGHLWTEALHDVFETVLVGNGLLGSSGGIGSPAGLLVGGDWGSWQYGPLSVIEYAAATRALEDNGAPQTAMDEWVNSLIVRSVYATLPKLDSQFPGNGDFDSDTIYKNLDANQLDAVLVGPSTDQAASWARFIRQERNLSGSYFWNALAELRSVTPQDYRAQTPTPSLWYLTRGLGNMYVRTSWGEDAYWAVFMSGSPEGDHPHYAASNFVFSRGGDHLIVDSANYGEPATFETNAVSADAAVTPGDYALTQGPFGLPALPWARGTSGGVFAARSDFAHAFEFNGTPSDIGYAHREWVLLPEGEVVTIDRVHTSADTRNAYVRFHTNTAGTLALDSGTGVATGTVGASRVAIHRVLLSGGTPAISSIQKGGCQLSCSFPCGACAAARFDVDLYSVTIPGSWAVAIHVIDGLAGSEQPAIVGSLNDDNFDPDPKQNAGIIGAAVFRGSRQSFVVASSAIDGAQGATMTYGVLGGSPARHVVFDAPAAADGTSAVTASAQSGRCIVSISAGGGGGLTGRPLAFQVASAADGCTVIDDPNVPAGTPPPVPDGGVGNPPPSGAANSLEATCGCVHSTGGARGLGFLAPLLAVVLATWRRRRDGAKTT